MGKHTPGPWENDGGEILAPDGMRKIAEACDYNGFEDWPFKERKANARLIAAAPDLLEALEYALKCVSIATDYSMSAAEATEFRCNAGFLMRKKARVAIAKAKGESDEPA